jgi:hypothetical protein
MTNLQLYLSIGLPTFAVLASLIVSLVQISGIRSELAAVRGDVHDLRADLREIRADIKLLTGKVYELMAR